MIKKEEIHIELLKEILIEQGFSQREVDMVDYDTILISGTGAGTSLYIMLDVDGDGFAFSLEQYMVYHNWWTSVERDKKIREIFRD